MVGLRLQESHSQKSLMFASLTQAILVGLRGLEPPTLRLSGVRSNHLSYKPIAIQALVFGRITSAQTSKSFQILKFSLLTRLKKVRQWWR